MTNPQPKISRCFFRMVVVKAFINFLTKKELIPNCNIDWDEHMENIEKYTTNKETLSQEELEFLIKKRELNDEFKPTLDSFLFQVYTTMRYCDMKQVTRDHIINDVIMVTSQKTGEDLVIPLNDLTKQILEDNNYNLNLFKFLFYYNRNIKKMLKKYSAEMPSFCQIRIVKKTTNRKKVERKEYRYNLFSSHRGRGTGITILSGFAQPKDIKKLTGYKTLNVLYGYIDKNSETKQNLAEMMLKRDKK